MLEECEEIPDRELLDDIDNELLDDA